MIYADFIPYKTACRVIDHLIQIDALIEFYHDGKSYADKKAITEHFMFIKTSRIGSRSILRFPEYRWMICENGFIRESLI